MNNNLLVFEVYNDLIGLSTWPSRLKIPISKAVYAIWFILLQIINMQQNICLRV